MIPIDVSKDKYSRFFNSKIVDKLNVVYSFANLNNYIIICDVDKDIRCWIRKYDKNYHISFNENIKFYESDRMGAISKVYYGRNPMLTFQNKLGKTSESYQLKIDKQSNINTINTNSNLLNINGVINGLGLLNENNECDALFKFDKKTLADFVFYTNNEEFYIIVMYKISKDGSIDMESLLSDTNSWY